MNLNLIALFVTVARGCACCAESDFEPNANKLLFGAEEEEKEEEKEEEELNTNVGSADLILDSFKSFTARPPPAFLVEVSTRALMMPTLVVVAVAVVVVAVEVVAEPNTNLVAAEALLLKEGC